MIEMKKKIDIFQEMDDKVEEVYKSRNGMITEDEVRMVIFEELHDETIPLHIPIYKEIKGDNIAEDERNGRKLALSEIYESERNDRKLALSEIYESIEHPDGFRFITTIMGELVRCNNHKGASDSIYYSASDSIYYRYLVIWIQLNYLSRAGVSGKDKRIEGLKRLHFSRYRER